MNKWNKLLQVIYLLLDLLRQEEGGRERGTHSKYSAFRAVVIYRLQLYIICCPQFFFTSFFLVLVALMMKDLAGFGGDGFVVKLLFAPPCLSYCFMLARYY